MCGTASVDEDSYAPASATKMGDHPVIWSNPHVRARNVYVFMGHGPDLSEKPGLYYDFPECYLCVPAAINNRVGRSADGGKRRHTLSTVDLFIR